MYWQHRRRYYLVLEVVSQNGARGGIQGRQVPKTVLGGCWRTLKTQVFPESLPVSCHERLCLFWLVWAQQAAPEVEAGASNLSLSVRVLLAACWDCRVVQRRAHGAVPVGDLSSSQGAVDNPMDESRGGAPEAVWYEAFLILGTLYKSRATV